MRRSNNRREPLRADTPTCDACERRDHGRCRSPCPCECRNPSYLAHYSLRSEIACWLMGRAPEIVAMQPGQLGTSDVPPKCPEMVGASACGEPMRWRPGFWKCFLHEEPVALRIVPDYERAPAGDVLAMLRQK